MRAPGGRMVLPPLIVCDMEDLRYGPRISQADFEQASLELIARADPDETAEQSLARERAEFFLLVDYRLGTQFPADRREALWKARQRVLHTSFWQALKLAWRRPVGDGLSELLVKEFSQVLEAKEVATLLGLDQNELVGLRPL